MWLYLASGHPASRDCVKCEKYPSVIFILPVFFNSNKYHLLMNCILKNVFKKEDFHHYQDLCWNDFAIQRSLSLPWSPVEESYQGSNNIFLKQNILCITNKYVLRNHWNCGNTCHNKIQSHHPQNLKLNQTLKEPKANWCFIIRSTIIELVIMDGSRENLNAITLARTVLLRIFLGERMVCL